MALLKSLRCAVAAVACLACNDSVAFAQSPNSSTASKPPPGGEEAVVTFSDDVRPIFRQHCAACHNQGIRKGGLALDSYPSLMQGGSGGEVVSSDGDVTTSRLWQLINHEDTPEMPPGQDRIPADQLHLVRRWIEGGVVNHSASQQNSRASKKRIRRDRNPLAMIADANRPNAGDAAMPQFKQLKPPVVTERAAAISAIACSPWAPLVAIAGQRQIVLYHTDTAKLLGILNFPEGVAEGLRFSRGGDFLIAAGGQHGMLGIVAVYDVQSGRRVATLGDELDIVLDGDASPSMSRLATGGPRKILRVYDADNASPVLEINKHTDWIYAVAFSPDGNWIASGDRSGGLYVWEADTGRLQLDLRDHKLAVHNVAWRDDARVLASGSADGTIKLWDIQQGKAVKSISTKEIAYDVAFDHRGNLASGGSDQSVKLWNFAGKPIGQFPSTDESILEVEFSSSGKQVVYGDWGGNVYLANIKDPTSTRRLSANPKPRTDGDAIEVK